MMENGDQEASLSIYFVRVSSTDKTDKDMVQAFKTCKKADLRPEWIDEEDIEGIPIRLNVVFVLRAFEGELFDQLASKECLVCGPRCLHTCVSMKLPVPENQSPVFTTPMRSLVVSSTKLPKEKKEEIKKLVGYMGGHYSDNLTGAVTHLVGNDSRSEKCEKAGELNIPVMRTSWVDTVWKESTKKDVSATDPVFDSHRLPAFQSMEITCSNLPQRTKKELQKIIEAHGGIYKTVLVQNTTYRLVIGSAGGDKFKHAQLWSIPCVSPEWVHDSAARGVTLDPTPYLVKDRPRCSTPTSELPSFMNSSSEISVIKGVDSTKIEINETASSTSSVFLGKPPIVRPIPQKPQQPPPGQDYQKTFENLNLSEASSAGLFLDGCKIFLSGFSEKETEKLKKILNTGGATIFKKLSDRVTHVVTGTFIASDAKAIAELQPRPHVVSLDWIAESLKCRGPASVEDFLCLQGETEARPPPQSPMSQKGLELLKSKPTPTVDTTQERPISRKLFVKAQNKSKLKDLEVEEPPKEPDRTGPERRAGPEPMELTGVKQASETAEKRPPSTTPSASTTQDPNTSAISEMDTIGPPSFFQGLVFEVSVPDPEETIKAIETAGGKVAGQNFHGVADYAVVTIDERESHFSAPELVTTLWVEDCFEHNTVVKVDYYHQPLNFKPGCQPLEGTAVCISGYIGRERTFLSYVAMLLGSNLQESFSRNDYPNKGIVKSTHLLCSEASGSKYRAAIKWGVPVVNCKWVLSSARSGKLEPPDAFPVTETQNVNATPVRTRAAITSIEEETPEVATKRARNQSKVAGAAFGGSQPPEKGPPVTPVTSRESGPAEQPPITPVTSTAEAPQEQPPVTPVTSRVDRAPEKPLVTPVGHAPPQVTPRAEVGSSSTPDVFATPASVAPSRKAGVGNDSLVIMKRKLSVSKTSDCNDDFEDDPFDFPESASKSKIRISDKNVTPNNARRLSIESAGPSPFHVDTPDTPYGQVFCDGPPSPATRKKWKKYIDKFPNMYEGSPVVTKERRMSTPLSVIKKQLWVKFGRVEIEGIESGTGNLLEDGPYSYWAKNPAPDASMIPGNAEEGSDSDSDAPKTGKTLDSAISGVTSNVKKNLNESTPVNHKPKELSKEDKENRSLDEDEEAAKLVADLRSQMPVYKRPSEVPGSAGRMRANTGKPKESPSYLQRESMLNGDGFDKFSGEDSVTWDHERPKFLEKVMERELKMKEVAKNKSLLKEKEPETVEDMFGGSEGVFGGSTQKIPADRVFTLSNINKNVREKYERIIRSLGGEVSEARGYDTKSTHLVIEQLVRSEKLLCTMASGKWVLHISYLDQCYEARMFLPEEDYEWGNPRFSSKLGEGMAAGSQEWLLARAAHKWRRRRTEVGPKASPFSSIRAVLLTPPNKTAQFTNLLLTGGATILDKQDILEATHCFANEGKLDSPVPLKELARKGIHVLIPVFLGDLLTKGGSVLPQDYWTETYKKLRSASL